MQKFQTLIIVAVLFCCVNGLNLPTNLKRCKRNEGNINECLKSAIQDALSKLSQGLSSFSFPSIEPLIVPSMTIGEGTSGAVHVVQNYKNVNIHGISKGNVEKVKSNITVSNFELDIDMILPSLKLEADYNFNGHVLVIPIVGKGNCTVNLNIVKAKLLLTGKPFEKKGKTYMDIQKVVMILKPKKVHFDFANLFNGDPRLGPEMNKLLNDNSESVFEDVRPGYEASLAIIIQSICNLIYHKVPFDDLFPL